MLKLRIFKFLGIFIPYFKRKMISKIQNRIGNDVMNHLNNYDKINLFDITWLSVSTNQNIVKCAITFRCVNFNISIEYTNNKIEMSFSCEPINCIETFSEISDFVKYFQSINQENLLLILKQYK